MLDFTENARIFLTSASILVSVIGLIDDQY